MFYTLPNARLVLQPWALTVKYVMYAWLGSVSSLKLPATLKTHPVPKVSATTLEVPYSDALKEKQK